ncbi:MAG: hypothetical protein J0H42_29775 [Rhizobiales bacterium]|nr:hypothetical protein [Hyphomicrobiales bacterium]
MTSTRVGIFGFFIGLLFWLLVLVKVPGTDSASQLDVTAIFTSIKDCVSGPLLCLTNVVTSLKSAMAYGAVLGIAGLLIQLWWRGEWPTGQLNAGRPKVLDPTALVTVTVAAIIAGISAAPLLTGKISALGVVAFSYFVADAVTLGVDKISDLIQKAKTFMQRRTASK